MKSEQQYQVVSSIEDTAGNEMDITALATVHSHSGDIECIEFSKIVIEDAIEKMEFEGFHQIPKTHFHQVVIDDAETSLWGAAYDKYWEDVHEEFHRSRCGDND